VDSTSPRTVSESLIQNVYGTAPKGRQEVSMDAPALV
jgi:hypothetical protein